jgi:hypothetical protein
VCMDAVVLYIRLCVQRALMLSQRLFRGADGAIILILNTLESTLVCHYILGLLQFASGMMLPFALTCGT